MKCDSLIIGAGPAGCSAAYNTSIKGLRTIIVDLKEEVGVPISCSGAIGSYLIPLLPFKIPPSLLEHSIRGLEFRVGSDSFMREGGPWTSYSIDRTAFDKWLAQRAVDAGAELLLETCLVDLELDSRGRALKAVLKNKDGMFEVEFKVLIAADGARSRVLDLLGERKPGARLGRALVYEYEGASLDSPDYDQLFFGDFNPGGYAHVFPLSETSANVGVGSILEVGVEDCMRRFLALPAVATQIKGATLVREKKGVVSFDRQSSDILYGNVLLAGEAGSQNLKPLIEGFLPAIICGDAAGRATAAHLTKGVDLSCYRDYVDRLLGPLFKESEGLVSLLKDVSDLRGEASYWLLAGLTSNVISSGEVKRLARSSAPVIKGRVRSKTMSRFRMRLLGLLEQGMVLFLQLRARFNRKFYKL